MGQDSSFPEAWESLDYLLSHLKGAQVTELLPGSLYTLLCFTITSLTSGLGKSQRYPLPRDALELYLALGEDSANPNSEMTLTWTVLEGLPTGMGVGWCQGMELSAWTVRTKRLPALAVIWWVSHANRGSNQAKLPPWPPHLSQGCWWAVLLQTLKSTDILNMKAKISAFSPQTGISVLRYFTLCLGDFQVPLTDSV